MELGMLEQSAAGFWLSPQQKFAWKLEQGVLRSAVRAICHVSLQGNLDIDRLRIDLESLVSRHEILRTVFRRQTGMKLPFQVVLDKAAIAWQEVDLTDVSSSDRHSHIEKLLKSEQTRRSILEEAPVLRATLVKLDQEHFSLIVSLPSLCADEESLKILVRELGLIYSREALPETFRYVQFAQWQGDLLESEEDEARRAREFWKKRQSASVEAPVLPNETKSEEFSFEAERVGIRVAGDVAQALIQRSDGSAILLSAWQSLLFRLSGQNSFGVGFQAQNREYEELENAVGCFARTLPIPGRVESDFRFADVLRQTQEELREAVAVQEYFVPEDIGTNGELVSFSYHDLGGKESRAGVGFSLERLQVVSEAFKLRLVAMRRESELELEFQYDASRLERATVERIGGYYQNLLSGALANPETLVSKLPLLPQNERKRLLTDWNQTAAAYPAERCLHELYEQQAARTPQRLAVRCGEHAFTYRELNERSNQLAHYLRQQGVGPDRLVGLCMERSAVTMVAVLGILKAGGAYVPLNPDNPPVRLKQQLEGAAALITESTLVGQMPEFTGPVLALDRDEKLWASQPKTNPAVNPNPENLVYVIYTSGSTGVPKGVGVRHRNLVNYAHFITQRLELSQYPEGLQFATVSTLGADLGNTCIYPSLISGGCLHIVRYETATDPKQLAEYSAKYPVDVLKIVPSHLQALLHSDDAGKLLPRKYLIFGGETLTPKLVEKIESLNPSCEILNHYGPTETTVGSLTLKLKDYDWKQAKLGSIPIGRPVANTQVYVLDQNLQPVPIGVTGELYIAGAGVTAGYLGQAEKTAERFISSPFATDADAKMYRTGDLARYRADGNIEFLGRGDDQVKVRGFRIELGEIEAVLARHEAVKQAVVLAREDEQGDKRLLAYVVLSREQNTSGEELRAYLKQQLPDYMVPQAVVILPKLPLNANGKLDRKALPDPEQVQSKVYVAPRTPTEQTIAEIWAEVLRKDKSKIGVDDNFFDLGGHSLLATQVISRIRSQFCVEVAMRAVFEHPTVEGLACAVEQAQESPAERAEVGIAAVDRETYRA
jgi:amino acid adenylation domain-containing protein